MKFKAVIESDAGGAGGNQMVVLHVLQALQRLDRTSERRPRESRGAGAAGAVATVVMKLTAESFAFCHRAGADEGSQTWSHFHISRLFKEYRIESKRGNRIDFEAPIANLVHVFQSCAGSDRTVVKLANGQDGRPVFSFEFSLAGTVADHRGGTEVPVRIIAEQEAEAICEPKLPEPDYQVELPGSLSRLRGVLERMRQVGAQHVTVEAGLDRSGVGEKDGAGNAAAGTAVASEARPPTGQLRAWLKLTTEAELVGIATTFPRLALVMEGLGGHVPEGPLRLVLSIRRLGEVLAAIQQVTADAHIACLMEGRALVLYALLPRGLGSLISYTPAISAE